MTDGFSLQRNVFEVRQPRVSAEQVRAARGNLLRYRIMAFTTGVVLLAGTIALILKYAVGVDFGGFYAVLWIAHGWLFVVYLITTAMLGFRMHWPLGRYVLVGLAGTIPTMSFVAEHFVSGAAKRADQAVPLAD